MRGSLSSRLSVRKFRVKRRARAIVYDVLKASVLLSLVSFCVIGMMYGYQIFLTHPYFKIRDVSVRGCKELTEKEILSLASVHQEQSIFGINTAAVERRIARNPWVKEVYVGREFPNRLVIHIVERTAVALVNQEGTLHLVDFDGVLFKKVERGDNADLPVLSGCITGGDVDSALFQKSLELLRYLHASKDMLTVKNVSEINVNEVFGISLFTTGGLCLRLGFDSFENKLTRLVPVMEDLERRRLNPEYLLIDLNDPTKIIVQKKRVYDPPTQSGAKKAFRT